LALINFSYATYIASAFVIIALGLILLYMLFYNEEEEEEEKEEGKK